MHHSIKNLSLLSKAPEKTFLKPSPNDRQNLWNFDQQSPQIKTRLGWSSMCYRRGKKKTCSGYLCFHGRGRCPPKALEINLIVMWQRLPLLLPSSVAKSLLNFLKVFSFWNNLLYNVQFSFIYQHSFMLDNQGETRAVKVSTHCCFYMHYWTCAQASLFFLTDRRVSVALDCQRSSINQYLFTKRTKLLQPSAIVWCLIHDLQAISVLSPTVRSILKMYRISLK